MPVVHTNVLLWYVNKYWGGSTAPLSTLWYRTTVIKYHSVYMWGVGMTDHDTRSATLSARVSLAISERLNADIESRLNATDSKSEWIREACQEKLDREQATEPASE